MEEGNKQQRESTYSLFARYRIHRVIISSHRHVIMSSCHHVIIGTIISNRLQLRAHTHSIQRETRAGAACL